MLHKLNGVRGIGTITLLALCAQVIACGRQVPPVTVPQASPALPEPPIAGQPTSRVEASVTIERPVPKDDIGARSPDELNRDSPFALVSCAYDNVELDIDARNVLEAAAEVLKAHPSWIVAIEGHCDERGTPEYNLALGERRAIAVEVCLVSLGVPGHQLRTVSYGKEFPLDPAHSEAAWAKNRRAQCVLISK